MIRCTTPTHEFIIPLDADVIADVWVTYKQGKKIVLEKKKSEMLNTENLWSYKLTQEETKAFEGDKFVCIQVKVLTTDGDVFASDKFYKNVEDVLNDEVMA